MDSSYRPQSPDLSGYAPQSPNLSSYAPQSPNFSGYRPQSPDLSGIQPAYATQPQHNRLHNNINWGGPAFNQPPTSVPQTSMPARRYKVEDDSDNDYLPDAPEQHSRSKRVKLESTGTAFANGMMAQNEAELEDPTQGCTVRTSFPVARIKRIMQADEDIGKVAQVTPTVVSRALELFMIRLISAAAHQARGTANGGVAGKGPKRVLVQHLKKAVLADPKLDFLIDKVSNVPDAPAKGKKEAGSDSEDAKPKKRSKKRKDSGDDF